MDPIFYDNLTRGALSQVEMLQCAKTGTHYTQKRAARARGYWTAMHAVMLWQGEDMTRPLGLLVDALIDFWRAWEDGAEDKPWALLSKAAEVVRAVEAARQKRGGGA